MLAAVTNRLSRLFPAVAPQCAFVCLGLVVGFTAPGVSSMCAPAQSPTQASAGNAQEPQNPATQQLPHVTTTVEVHSKVGDDYLAGGATAGSLDGTVLKETPVSVTAVSRAVLSDQISRTLSD